MLKSDETVPQVWNKAITRCETPQYSLGKHSTLFRVVTEKWDPVDTKSAQPPSTEMYMGMSCFWTIAAAANPT